jgi:hypothetical protein
MLLLHESSHSVLIPLASSPPPAITLGFSGPAESGRRSRATPAVDGSDGGCRRASLNAGDAHRLVGEESGAEHGGAAAALHVVRATGSALGDQ